MEAKNMELNPLNEANENQLRYMVKYLTVELETMKTVCRDNSILQTKNNIYKLKGEENVNNNSLNKEILELRKQLKIRKELSDAWKDEQEHILKLEEQLEAKERDIQRQLPYKKECLQLRKKNRDLKVAMRQQEKQLMEKNHLLKLDVAELQEEINKLQRKNVKLQEEKLKHQEETSKEHQLELAQKQKALLTEKKCSELEKQLKQTLRELHVKMPPSRRAESCSSDAPSDTAMLYEKHIEVVRQLIVERNRLERKDHIIKEKEKQIEELKHSVSKSLPFESNPESQWVSREQSKTISALTAQVQMLYSKAEEDKREREKLVDEVGAIKKKYLNGKMQNTELREALRRSGAKQVPEEKSGDIQVPPRSTVLHRQSGEKRVNTKMQPVEAMPARLPPIGNSFCTEQPKDNQTHQYKMS